MDSLLLLPLHNTDSISVSALQIKITSSDIPGAQAAAQLPPALVAAKQVSAGVSHIVCYIIDKGTLD